MIGTRLSGRYELLKEIGRGGMGTVFLAHDPLLERDVAVKIVSPTFLSPEGIERFKRETRIVAGMDHPAIVAVHDTGVYQESLFFVMPYVEGTSLRTFLDERSLSLGDVLDVISQVAEALEYSHSKGIIHRDIKPENILITRQMPEGTRVRITDFGLAVASSQSRLSLSGTVTGTIAYLSPEQLTDNEIDGRADVYSLGTVLYECLVGQPPFSGDVRSVLYRIAHEIPQPPRLLAGWIPEELEELILQCLEKNPSKRPQRAWEVTEALLRFRSRLSKDKVEKKIYPQHSSAIQHQGRDTVSFIGREREFAELQRRLSSAIQGECQFVVVTGEAGIGKSRLLDELEPLIRARKVPVLHGRFIELDQSFPYQGFCEVIQEYFRTVRNTSGPVDFSDLAPELLTLFPVLTEIDEIRSAVPAAPKVVSAAETRKEDRTYIFEVIARSLTRIAGGRPLVIMLEDLHAADVSIDAMQYIARRLSPTPTLLIATYRNTEVDKGHPIVRMLDSFHGDRRFALIQMGLFSPSEHRSFLGELIGSSRLDDRLAEKLYEATEGNPYFTKELVRSLMDSKGIIEGETGAWVLSQETGLSSGTLPATIQQTVKKRIERLSKDFREILSIASVLGKTFEYRDLEVLAEEKEDLEGQIDQLVEEAFIEEERESRGGRLTFSSGMMRDVLYSALTPRKRRSIHRKYAEELERRHAGRLERVYPQLVHHYLHGDVPEKVVEYGLSVARKSLEALSVEDAVRSARMVLDFLDEVQTDTVDQLEAEAKTVLAQAQRMLGNIDDALKELEDVILILERRGTATKEGDKSSEMAATILMATETAWQGRKIEETRRWVEKGVIVARAEGNVEFLTRFLSLGSTLANLRGDYQKAKEYQQEAEQLQPVAKAGVEEIPTGGKLIVALPASVRPVYTADTLVEEQEILGNVFETLLKTDAQGNLVPWLCERWEVLEKGKSFRFMLRKNVRLHNGRRLTAQEVKTSFENTIGRSRQSSPAAFMTIRGFSENSEGTNIEGIKVLSEDELGIELVDPLPIYPSLLSDPRTGIVLEEDSKSIGTGPFQMTSLSADRVILERNPDYWKGNSPFLDTVECRTSLSAAEIAAGFRSGEFDMVRDLLPEDLDAILRDRRLHPTLVEAPKKNIYFILFSMSSIYNRIPMLRWALSGVLRSHDLVHGTLGRFAQPAEGILPPGILGHEPGRRRFSLERDKVMELLHSSRLPLPIQLKASVHPILQDRYASLTKALFKVWADIGVHVSIETTNMASFQEKVRDNDGIDLMLGRWIADYDDPDNFTYALFHSNVGRYRNYYCSPELDKIMEEARAESRPEVREKLYRKAEGLLMETAFFLPLFHDIDYRVANSRVRGLTLQSSPPYVNYSELGKVDTAPTAVTRKSGGGIVHIPMAGEIHSLDPSMVFTIVQSEILPAIFENLTRQTEDSRIVPWLASEYHAEEGGRRFRFRLRDGVRFHDGRRLTARDVRYSFEHLLQNHESVSRWLLSSIRGASRLLEGKGSDLDGLQILSSTEFVIDLDQPVSFFPALLAYTPAAIIPEGTTRFDGSWRDGCVGSGPYRVERFEPGKRLELDTNPYYWRSGFPKNDGLDLTFGVSPAEILSGFKTGQFSLAWDLFPSDVEALRRDSGFTPTYRETPRLSTYYLFCNIHSGPLADEKLRHQLLQALDVDTLVSRHVGRLAIPAHGLIPPGLLGYEPRKAKARPSTKKKEIVQNVELTGMIHSVYEGPYSALAEEIFNTLGEKGFRVKIVETKADAPMALESASVDFVLQRWFPDYPDADSFVHGLLRTKEGFIGRFCGTDEIDRLIEKGRMESDPELRHEIYREIEQTIVRHALLLPLFHEQTYRFARPEVEGFEVTFCLQTIPYENLWIRQ